MNVLFVSRLIQKDQAKSDIAGNVQCWNFVNGIEHCTKKPVNLISDLRTPLWPLSRHKLLFKSKWSHKNNSADLFIGRINITKTLSSISKAINLYFEIRKWIRSQSEKHVVFVYSMHTPYLLPVILASKKDKSIICLIVPDLPGYMRKRKKFSFSNFLKYLDNKILYYFAQKADYYVLFTESMAANMEIKHRKWLRVESLASEDIFNSKENNEKAKENVIFYSGSLDIRYGIKDLIEAFLLIGERYNAKLCLCGEGDAVSFIQNTIEENQNISYLGQINREDVLTIQRKVKLLVNPRSAQEDFTKFSFPSKTLEYMLSGTPVIMRKLPGIPQEYHQYLIIDEEGTVDSLARTIEDSLNISNESLVEFGRKAREFIIKEKHPNSQCEKICKMIGLA